MPIFIDTRSYTSVMSYELWVAIGKKAKLLSTKFPFKSFNKIKTNSLQTCYANICIQDEPIYELFYVVDKKSCFMQVLNVVNKLQLGLGASPIDHEGTLHILDGSMLKYDN